MTVVAGERGYALVAVVAMVAVVALIALAIMSQTRQTISMGAAEVGRAKAEAAADAGIVLGLDGLLSDDIARRWSLDGRPYSIRFDGARVVVRLADERGKIPINLIEEAEITVMLEAIGLSGAALRTARDSFLDWRDEDDDVRAAGAEAAHYRLRGISPRNGPLLSLGELQEIRGLAGVPAARLAEAASVDWITGSFEARYADPLALGVMLGGGANSPEAIARAREIGGQRTAIDLVTERSVAGKIIGVKATATLPGGARATRRCIVDITGSGEQPFVVRRCE